MPASNQVNCLSTLSVDASARKLGSISHTLGDDVIKRNIEELVEILK